MADPAIIDCPAGAWTPVAVNVTAGVIHIKNKPTGPAPNVYLQTYRDTGAAAPADADLTTAIPFDTPLQISNTTEIDVYVQPRGADGRVRADL